jgi:hypothetical protein
MNKTNCNTCKHNHNIYYADDFHSYCPEGNCTLCMQQSNAICEDYEEGIAVEETEK